MIEHSALARVAEDFRRRGYDVRIEPRGQEIPQFLEDFKPDMIAIGPSESVVVEVRTGTRTSVAERLHDVAERVNRQPGWRFAVVMTSPDRPDQLPDAPLPSVSTLEEYAQSGQHLADAHQLDAAFLLLWSALEGTLRLIGRRRSLPVENLPTSALIRELYSAGEISRRHFDAIMRLLGIRNRLVHGFSARPGQLEVDELSETVTALLAELRAS